MTQNSSIEWTDHTFNPWWGCTKVSPGCAFCYAESIARRFGGDVWGQGKVRRTFGDDHWKQPLKWNRRATQEGRRARVFCASMADIFDPDGPDSERQRLWRLIERTPCLDWQLLTKRPEAAISMLPHPWLGVPRQNVWMGTSVEDRKRLTRIDVLRAIPAAIRFLSIEPLLEDLSPLDLTGIHWVITGGESGKGARPMDADWVRRVRDQCLKAGVAIFHKQYGHLRNNPDAMDPTAKENGAQAKGGRLLDGRMWNEMPARCDQTKSHFTFEVQTTEPLEKGDSPCSTSR